MKKSNDRRILISLVFAIATLLQLGCGSGVTGASTSPTPQTTPGTPSSVTISITPTSAAVQLGNNVQFTATVAGSTNASVTWTTTGGSITSSGLYTPGSTGTFQVTATSVADTTKAASATVLVSAAQQSAQLSAPATLGFGSVLVSNTLSQNLTLSNTGSSSVSITAANVSGTGFALGRVTFPISIASGSAASVPVTFTPSAAGSFTGSISIVNNTSTSPLAVSLTGTGIVASNHSVDLSWNGSTSSVQGYFVYRSSQSGVGYSKISALVTPLLFTDYGVQAGQTYYYVITAMGTDGIESAYSNEASATVPVP